MLSTATNIAVWIIAAVFCSLYLYPKPNTEIQHNPKYKVHVIAKCKCNYGWFLLGYVITIPSKALTCFNITNVYMVKDRI